MNSAPSNETSAPESQLLRRVLPLAVAGVLAVALLTALLVARNRLPATIDSSAQATKATGRTADHLPLALDSLRKLAEGHDAQPIQRTVFYLNQWISSLAPSQEAWQPDRLIDRLPTALKRTPGMDRLDKLQFTPEDVEYLQQTLWLHDIASRMRRDAAPARLQPWLKTIEAKVGLPEAEQLALAERMFDWTIRNIQLEPLPPPPKGPSAGAGSGDSEASLPALQGEVGPGYGNLPLQVLLYGRGDAHERARIFMLLCRQVGIETVMLGFLEKNSTIPRGWLPGVLAAGQVYLFDTSLGLPLPGPEGEGIATLEQVVADSQLLRRLDVTGLPAYPVTGADLGNVVALVDAEPAALSRRMQLLQGALPRETRLALSVRPRQLEVKLQTAKAIRDTTLWRVPFEAIYYQYGLQRVLASDEQAARAFRRKSAVFAPDRPLVRARNLHLQGRFDNEEQKPGARTLYMQCRPPEREMTVLANSDFFRKSIGLDAALPEDPQQQKAFLEEFIAIARDGKFNATYWLGLTYYESGKYETAIEWLSERTVQADPPSPWTPGARYNLARCYEQLGELDVARRWLESDPDSPQRHGNLLRARLLTASLGP